MNANYYIDRSPFDCRILGFGDDGRLNSLDWTTAGQNRLAGAIFAGRVVRVEAKMAAAFVDIGLERHAFLRAKDARALAPGIGQKQPPIDKLVQEGMAVIVQVDREPEGSKGARVSADIRIEGRGGLYFPRRPGKGGRGRLKGFFDPKERDRLYALWDGIIGGQKTPPALLWQDTNPIDHLLRNIDEDANLAVVGNGLRADLVGRGWPLEQIQVVDALPEDGEDELAALTQPVVPLVGGGDLVIEPTTALTAIDVNGAGRDALSVNRDAAAEISRQLRLRDIGGLVVVDFISLQNADQDQVIEAAMDEALMADPLPTHMAPLSPFGLMEISRRRQGPALHERLYDHVPMAGWTLKPLAAAALTWRAAISELKGFTGGKLRLTLHPDMADIWLAGDPCPRDLLMRHAGCHVEVDSNPSLAMEDIRLSW